MADTPDTTAAFEAEADPVDRSEKEARVAKIRAELAELEAEPEVIVPGENNEDDGKGVDVVEPEEIDVDGNTWHYFPPTEGQFTVFAMASTKARGLTPEKRMTRMYGFLSNVLTEDSFEEALARVEDRTDEFSFDDLMRVVTEIARVTADSSAPKNRAERRAVARSRR